MDFKIQLNKAIKSIPLFILHHKKFTIISAIYLCVIILSRIYTPWTTSEYNSEMNKEISWYLAYSGFSSSVVKLMFSIFYAGISDIMSLFAYSMYGLDPTIHPEIQSVQGGFVAYFIFSLFVVFTIQKVVADKILDYYCASCISVVEEQIVSYMIGNIVFATSAYLLYFLYPIIYDHLALMANPIVELAIGALLMVFTFPGMCYIGIYILCFYGSFWIINYIYNQVSFEFIPSILTNFIVMIFVLILAILTDYIAGLIEKKLLGLILRWFENKFTAIASIFRFLFG